MTESDSKATIRAKVESLAQRAGLQRTGLATSLGDGLCRLWDVNRNASDKAIREKIVGKLMLILESIPDDSTEKIVIRTGCLAFNISTLTGGKMFSYTDRQNCLDRKFRSANKLQAIPFSRTRVPVRDQMGKVYDSIAAVLYEEWLLIAPGEPFPTDAALDEVASQHGDGDVPEEPARDDSPTEEAQDEDRHDVVVLAAEPSWGAEPPPVQVVPYVPSFGAGSPTRPFWSRRRAVVVTGLAVVLVAGVTVGAIELSHSGGGAAAPKPGEVVHVDSVAYVRDGTGKADGWSYVMPQKVTLSASDLADVGRLENDRSSYESWMTGHGGVTPDDATIQMVLSNPTSHAVTITNIDVVKQCEEPLSGTLFWSPPQGATGDTLISFNLDDRIPVAKDSETGASYFAGQSAHTIQLNPSETATLQLDATSTRSYCQFHFNLTVDPGDGGSTVTQPVYDHGKPFAVTAIPSAGGEPRFANYQAVYADDTTPTGFGSVDPVTYH